MLLPRDMTTTTTTNPTPTTTPDTDDDTPPHDHTIKLISISNATTKKQHQFHYYHHQPQPPFVVVTYKECLKNHAATLGGHALDGCGEFMPSPSVNPTNSTPLKCSACGCHRNFHRRELESYPPTEPISPHYLDFRHPRRPSPSPSPSPPHPLPSKIISYTPQTLLAFDGTTPKGQRGGLNQQPHVTTPVTPTTAKAEGEKSLSGKKRFRSRFTTEQKEKMFAFAEKLGWKMQRSDESKVERFCTDIGVARGVFKVWMHNHKNRISKSDMISNTNGTIASNMGVENEIRICPETACNINNNNIKHSGEGNDDGGQ